MKSINLWGTTPRRTVLLSLVCLAATLAPAVPASAAGGVDQETEEPAPPRSSSSQPSGDDAAEPEEHEWLVDELGRRYRIVEIPKHEGHYKWVEEDRRVRLQGGMVFEVLSHDEDSFSVKLFDAPDYTVARKPTPEAEAAPAPEPEPAPVEPVPLPQVDRLRFEPFDRGLPGSGQWRNSFALGDMDGDGHLDIVHGPPRKGGESPRIFLGDGAGSWRPWAAARFPRARLDYGGAAVADFNRDGVLDVAFASHLRGLKAFVGDGRGGFTEWSDGLPFGVPGGGGAPSEFSARVVKAVDWNQDGLPDLLTLGEGPRFARAGNEGRPQYYEDASGPVIFLNQGDGSWRPVMRQAELGRRHYGDALAVADFDGDGRGDFVVGSAARGKRDVLHLAAAGDEPWKAEEIAPLRRGSPALRALAVADFDGDGAPDLAVGYSRREDETWRSGVDVLLSRPDGEWELRPVLIEEGAMGIWALAAGDLDGDGHADLAAFGGMGDGYVFLGAGDGSFAREDAPEVGPPDWGCRGYHAAIRDLDGDGRGELLAGFAGESGSEVLLSLERTCPGGGGLRVWKPVPAPAPDVAPEGRE